MSENQISWRHHYIPEYFIKFFYNKENAIHVFDKKKKEYVKNSPKSAKTIFYKRDRNITTLKNQNDDILEKISSVQDSKLAIQLRKGNSMTKDQLEDDQEYLGAIHMFINWTLWRNPSYDIQTKKYIEENLQILAKMGNNKYDKFLENTDQESKIKFYRSIIPFYLAKESKNEYTDNDISHYKIYEHQKEAFIISDNPILIQRHPEFNLDLGLPCILPISPKRIYISLETEKYTINNSIIKLINFLLIENAERYIASPNKEFLDYYINFHRLMEDRNPEKIIQLKNQLWMMLQK